MAAPACVAASDAVLVSAAEICCDGADLGFTEGGITIAYEPTFLDVFADQVQGKINRALTDETLTVSFSLIEMTLNNIRLAMGLPTGNLADGTSLTPAGSPLGVNPGTDPTFLGDAAAYQAASGVTTENCLVLGQASQCGTANRCELSLIGEAPACCARAYYFPCAQATGGFEISLSRDALQTLSVTYEVFKLADGSFGRVCDFCNARPTCANVETEVYGA